MVNTFTNPSDVMISSATAQKLKSLIPKLSVSEARVAQYILLNLEQISFETGTSIAEKAAVSQITVSRFLKRAGYHGIASLKEEVKREQLGQNYKTDANTPLDSRYQEHMKNDMQALMRLYEQFGTGTWDGIVGCVSAARKVYVTGFQSIRGTAEDVSRRLSFARDNVQYLSAHDGMLAEWLGMETQPANQKGYDVLILLDIVPYAVESRRLCDEARKRNIQIVIITDEFCHWAEEYTSHICHTKSKADLFLESTWGIVMAANMLVHSVGAKNPDSEQRVKRWNALSKSMNLF